jgi:UDP-glucose 4-epimerase
MKIAVTGGSGFIGSHVVDHLLAAGHEVVVVDTLAPHRPEASHAAVDIRDVEGLTDAFAGVEVVFHLAAVSDVNVVAADPLGAVDLNVGATARVWEAARLAGVRRSVLASTVWVYQAAVGEGPVDETAAFSPIKPVHLYTSSKLAAEMVVTSANEMFGQEFTILRYGVPFGPRMRPALVIAKFLERALAGQSITLQGDGLQYRNYVYVRDLADGHLRAMGDVAANEVFNLEGAKPVAIRDIAYGLGDILGRELDIEFTPARTADFAGRDVSAAKALDVLGWTAATQFPDGLREYVEWYLAGPGADRAAHA